jgi:hypothetical protein
MAIRRIISFDHFPPLNGFGIGNTANANDKYMSTLMPEALMNVSSPGYAYCTIPSSYPTGAITRSGQWFQIGKIGPETNFYKSSFGLPYLALSGRDVARSYIGFRYISSVAGAGTLVFHVKSPTAASALFSFDMATLALSANTEYYIEIMIDRVRKLAVAWVNDVRVASVTVDFTAYATTYPDVAVWIGPVENNVSSNSGSSHAQRDMYFVDDMGDGLQESGRLGPGMASQLTLSNSAMSWGSTSGSGAYADLNQPITLTTYTPNAVPAAVSTYLGDIANLSFASPFGAGDIIRGVQLAISAQGLSGAAKLNTSWNNSTQNLSAGTAAFSQGAMLFNQQGSVVIRGPDGKRLRGSDLSGLQLALAPSL